SGRTSSWNLRDEHMTSTIETIASHLQSRGRTGKVVVWAHNSHLGDARATEMSRGGEMNVGQMMRERHPHRVCLIGFSTFTGSVTAASAWDAPAERKRVNEGLPGSYERLFHEVGLPDFYLPLRGNPAADELAMERLQRAIGVIYLPHTERF